MTTNNTPAQPVKGFKGFDQNFKCRDKQYALGQSYEEPSAKACNRGMHFCENAMDVFNYYPPGTSRYAEVEGDGTLDRDGNDSKVAATRLHVKAEVSIHGLIQAGVKFILDRVNWKDAKESNTGYQSAATNTGNRSAATNTGDGSAATNTGYQSAATNTGNRSAATNTGYQSAASVEGKESVAMAIGYEGKAKGALGCWLVLAEWEERATEYGIKDVRSVRVDGDTIKADTWYKLQGGEFVEVTD